MSKRIARRKFLAQLGGLGGLLLLRSAQPGPESAGVRALGQTGVRCFVLGLGTAPLGVQRASFHRFSAVFETALSEGVQVVDTAPNYGPAEEYLGRLLGDREGPILLTKVGDPSRVGALRQIEISRRRLRRDQLDGVLIHHVGAFPPELLFGPEGAWAALVEAKTRGIVRWIGVAGHYRPERFLPALDDPATDLVMMPINYVDRYTYGFESRVLPGARRRDLAVLATQVLGGARGMRYDRPTPALLSGPRYEPALRYALSLEGISCVLIGAATPEEIRQAARTVRTAEPLRPEEWAALRRDGLRLAQRWGPHLGPVM
ncbi:MAG: hypothetical protein KatS3mg115_2171 [Candidatus Poribacteria bacterium]|nr:MAG: hypothetical protein KatS3mg115_2171 [Candidatus Poribacteria bacterium]